MSNKLKHALGDWSESTNDVKSRIYAQTTERTATKRKTSYIKIGAAAAILSMGVAAAVISSQQPQSTETKVDEVVPPLEQTEEQQELRVFSENLLNILQYELFYNNYSLDSQEAVQSRALSNAIQWYSLFDYLQQHDYFWDEEMREFWRKQMQNRLEYDLRNEKFKAYFEKMKVDLNITEEDYVEEYLLVQKEYEALQSEMYDKNIGTQQEDGTSGYPAGEQEVSFEQKMGIEWGYMEYLAERIPERLEPLDPQPKLPFETREYGLQVALNAQGEYIFVDEDFSYIDLTDRQIELFYAIEREHDLPEFSRLRYEGYKEIIQDYAASAGEFQETAKEILEIFTILERTIDWELDVNNMLLDQSIPSFDTENLRIHNDLTMNIMEHELYYRSSDLPERYYAYRLSYERVVTMYGLFNHLQTYSFGWDKATRQRYRDEISEQLQQDMEDPYFKAYLDSLFAEFNITIDDYINYYLLVEKEYEVLRAAMVEQRLGVDEDGRYGKGEADAKYREAVGLVLETMYDTMWAMDVERTIQSLDSQPELPFELNKKFPLEVGLNEQGQYVFLYPSLSPYSLSEAQTALLEKIQKQYNLEDISRFSLQKYWDRIKEITGVDQAIANELNEIFIIFDRSIN